MATISVKVCDKCKTQDGVETYELKKGDARVRLDLCVEHGAPVDQLLKLGGNPTTGARKTRAPRGPSKTKVTTLEEIEEMKRKKQGD